MTKRELVFLGTGGAANTPRVGCMCEVCEEARRRGERFCRNGPSVFLSGSQILFDTPEDIGHSLEREGIHRVNHLTYSHWHPDHTMGRRILEQLNLNILNRKAQTPTEVWLADWVRQDFRRFLGLEDNFEYFEKIGVASLHEISEGEPVQLSNETMQVFRMNQPELACFLIRRGNSKIVLALDETKDWKPKDELREPDLLVMEMGWFERSRAGDLQVPIDHWLRKSEASFEETLRIIEDIMPQKAILTHIDEINGRSYSDYVHLEQEHNNRLQFAYDGLRIAL